MKDLLPWSKISGPIYSIAKLFDIDANKNEVMGVGIMDEYVWIWYRDDNNIPCQKSMRYELN